MSTKTQAQIEKKKEGILLKCPHIDLCGGRIWRYKGAMRVYAICPDCRGTVLIAKNRIEESES